MAAALVLAIALWGATATAATGGVPQDAAIRKEFCAWRDARSATWRRPFFFKDDRPKVWHAHGALTDPASGRVYARVVGVEAARAVDYSSDGKLRNASSADDTRYAVPPATTAISRAYRYVGVDDDELETFEKRPVRQPRCSASLVSHALLRDGETVEAVARASTEAAPIVASNAKFGFTAATRRLDTYVTPEGAEQKAPRRVLGFAGKPPDAPAVARAKRGLRCRETYVAHKKSSISGDTTLCSYTRFGECPAWAGPGKLCALDLTLEASSGERRRRSSADGDELSTVLEREATDGLEVLLEAGRPGTAPPPERDGGLRRSWVGAVNPARLLRRRSASGPAESAVE